MTTLMEKVAEVDPDTYQFLVNIAPAIQTSPFNGEIVQEMDGIIKKAASQIGATAGRMGMQLGTNVAGGVLMALAGDMYEAAKRGLTKSRHYRNMLDANPDLKEMPKGQVMDAFSVLHQFNPEFASNPTVSGAFVRKNSQYPEFDVKQLGDLVSSHKGIHDTKRLPQSPFRLDDGPEKGMHPLEMEEKGLKNEGQRMHNWLSQSDIDKRVSEEAASGHAPPQMGMAARAKMLGHKGQKK